jgi:hypothetical protein
LTKEQIQKAVEQGIEIKRKYPEFYKMHEIIISLNVDLNPEWFIKTRENLVNQKLREAKNGKYK